MSCQNKGLSCNPYLKMDDNLPDAGRHEASVGSGMQATDVVHATHALGLGTFCDKSKRCWCVRCLKK